VAGCSSEYNLTDTDSPSFGIFNLTPLNNSSALGIGYINEGDKSGRIRDGFFADFLLTHNINPYINAFIGIGPYITYTLYQNGDKYHGAYHLNTIIATGATFQVNRDILEEESIL
jgi:hypothetical protein